MADQITKYFVRYDAETDWVEVTKGLYDNAGLIMEAGWERYPSRYQLNYEPDFEYLDFADDYEYVTQDCGC